MADAAPALTTLDNALAAAVKAVGPSVVHVARGHHQGGTGIVWDADLVITSNFHTPDRTRVGLPTDDGELDLRDAEVIGRDAGTDVALLRVSGGGLTPASFRELGDVSVGNLALAIGRPGRTARASLRAIGVLGPEVETPHGGTLDRYLESDRQIPRGFAGGPLVTPDGGVLGMNTRTLIRGADIAVPTATLKTVAAELLAHGGIRKGYLGVGAFPSKHGAIIASLEDDGPAAKAGVIVGDIISEVDGETVTGPDTLRSVLASRPDKAVKIVLLRGGTRTELDVTIGSRS
jgi:serine protease DegQ